MSDFIFSRYMFEIVKVRNIYKVFFMYETPDNPFQGKRFDSFQAAADTVERFCAKYANA